MKLAVEAGIFGGNPRSFHGKHVGYIEIEETATLLELEEKILQHKEWFNEPVRVLLDSLDKTIKEAGITEEKPILCIFSTRFD